MELILIIIKFKCANLELNHLRNLKKLERKHK